MNIMNNNHYSIQADHLHKSFSVPIKGQSGWRSIFLRRNEQIQVINDVNLHVPKGQIVGYIGANGAGKSTTIKMLTGIITPTKGTVRVLGMDPHKQRRQYTQHIGVVFGQRSLLEYDIPVRDSLNLYKAIYRISNEQFTKRLQQFSKLLEIHDLLHIPVRKLSLGQRMRCEIAASLLHKPAIVFLDEPTIGLDVLAKQHIREFLKHINKTEKTTILLTTHDMDDIQELAHRIVFINKGTIIYDGDIPTLTNRYVTHYELIINCRHPLPQSIQSLVIESTDHEHTLQVPRKDVQKILRVVLESGDIDDLAVHKPRLEAIVRNIYQDDGIRDG